MRILEGKIYNINLYAITDLKKTNGNNSISKMENIIITFFKLPCNLNFVLLSKNINAGMKFIIQT